MRFSLRKAHAWFALAVIAVFVASLLVAYWVMTLLPMAYYEQRVYSTPSSTFPPWNSSVAGGEALAPEVLPADVSIGPEAGSTNVSRDTLIYMHPTRPAHMEFNFTPEIEIARIAVEPDFTTEITIFYPAGLLQPATTYNVSGSFRGASLWWTFTTGLEPSQLPMERILSPNIWWIAVAAATIAASIFTVTLWRRCRAKHLSQS